MGRWGERVQRRLGRGRGGARADHVPPFPGATYADWIARYEPGPALAGAPDGPDGPDVRVVGLAAGDRLAPHAADRIAAAFAAAPDAVVVTFDTDELTAAGHRHHPRFLPALNLDLLRSTPYVGDVVAVRADLAAAPLVTDATSTHDLLLRVVDAHGERAVVHVAAVLAHLGPEHRPPTRDATVGVVAAHLARAGLTATVAPAPHGADGVRVRWPVPDPPPPVTLVIPTRDHAALLRTALDSIARVTDYPAFDVVVVDNGSTDPAAVQHLAELARDDARVTVVRDDRPFDWSALNNLGAARARGEVLVFVNDDVEAVDPEWLTELVTQAVRPDVGVVGARLWYPDATLQHGGMVLHPQSGASVLHRGLRRDDPGYLDRAQHVQDLSAVTGACLATRASVLAEVGGFDSAFPVDFGDIDYCLRVIDAGYRCVWTPHAELVHHEGASRGGWDARANRDRFATAFAGFTARWGDRLRADPAWNRNAAVAGALAGDPPLAWPPR